jgi:chromosomal replication initiator protein
LDATIRESLLRRTIDECCEIAWPENVIQNVNTMLTGDGRVIQGFVHLVATLQRMFQRMPTMDEIHQYGGQLLRSSKPTVTLSVIERAVAQAFQLPPETLRSHAKTRTASEPRMLAMYLSRELTSAAYSEIGRFYGGRSHSTAIVASQKVKTWLEKGKTVGRGAAAISAREALERIESIVRSA